MKRRNFIKRSMGTAALPFMLNGLPMRLLANQLTRAVSGSTNDHIVVMIQMMGGNDGLNTLIPVDQYDRYEEYRSNIAIPEQGNRKYILMNENDIVQKQLGLHPEMSHFKQMYDDGQVTVVQNVAYDNVDLSHFRGRDIWLMGGSASDYWHSGWMGRYLDGSHPGYPEDYPNEERPDPLGLEFGYNMSLIFQREQGIPAGLAIVDPQTFYDLISEGGVEPPAWLPQNRYGEEMQYLMDLELKSNQYADRIKEVYDQGVNAPGVDYPETYPGQVVQAYKKNELAWQLKAVARLLSGGSKTQLFVVKLNGFDTHADQTLANDSTQGIHAALLYHTSSAIKAFYEDLQKQGFDKKVLTFTTSEFGRRVYSNGSLGTDHGTAAPVFLFGPMMKTPIFGNPPDLDNLEDGNLLHEFDYRQIYTSILADWLSAPDDIVEQVGWTGFMDSRLDLFESPDAIDENKGFARVDDLTVYPNPASTTTNIRFSLGKSGLISLAIYDLNGRKVRNLYEGQSSLGEHLFTSSLSGLPKGYYLVRLRSGYKSTSKKLLIQ